MNIVVNNNGMYEKVYTSYFDEMTNDMDYVNSDYDVLTGKVPTAYNELALVVDSYNSISASILDNLGFIDLDETLTFNDIISKEYKLIDNNNYYKKVDNKYYTMDYYLSDLYNNSPTTLKIVGILRPKKNAKSEIYSSSLLYTKELTDYVYNKALESDIVKEQLEYGLGKDVFSGEKIEDVTTLSYTQYASYRYENILKNLGAMKQTNRFYIYTEKFSDRVIVEEYINNYNNDDSFVSISYSDYMTRITQEFKLFVEILTKVLVIFAFISLFVSSIMIAVISYISVKERTKEIGILRSIGARRLDIFRVFTTESIVIGFFSGIIGFVTMFIFKVPINNIIKELILENTSLIANMDNFNVLVISPYLPLFLIFGSILVTIIAGFVPSFKASLNNPIKSLNATQ